MDAPPLQFARSRDGVRIAFSQIGSGPLVVDMPAYGLGGLHLLEVPAFSQYYEELTKRCTVVGFDFRGFGHSQRGDQTLSLESFMEDLDAIVERACTEPFTLVAQTYAVPVAIAYAAAHPEHVRSLVLFGGHLDGGQQSRETSAPALRPLISSQFELFLVSGTAVASPPTVEDGERLVEAWLRATDRASVADFYAASDLIDVTDLAERLDVPTLVLTAGGAPAANLSIAEDMASRIPGARLQLLTGRFGFLAFGDVAETTKAIEAFVYAHEGSVTSRPSDTPVQTILFTDLESSTALTQRLGDAGAQEVLHGHNDAVRKSLEAHGGREVKHTGDGIMAAFPSAVRAVEAALQIQRDLAGAEVRVRIGLNAGEPIAEDDDFFGTAVQLAARICDRAEPGQILVSRVVADLCAGKQLSFQSAGEAHMKGFDKPVALYQVGG